MKCNKKKKVSLCYLQVRRVIVMNVVIETILKNAGQVGIASNTGMDAQDYGEYAHMVYSSTDGWTEKRIESTRAHAHTLTRTHTHAHTHTGFACVEQYCAGILVNWMWQINERRLK